MPKKFKGENSKAAEARARKQSAKQAEDAKKQKEAEDAYWADTDKHVNAKLQRKEERERKQREAQQRKQELAQLYEEEMASTKVKVKAPPPPKLTVAQIQTDREKKTVAAAAAKKEENIPVNELPLEENINREEVANEARSVEEAISVLSTHDPAVDKHPEKRMKAAYAAFSEVHLPRLKAENPNMRLSQLKQMLHKDWMKSPENPLNQARLQAQTKS